jgi:thymidylate synthase ThyX
MEITAKVIQHSISLYTDREIITYELEYPRYIHSEFMTHRLFSRNAASSRAIPTKTMIEQIKQHNVEFVHYGKNQPGMQAETELSEEEKQQVLGYWKIARNCAIEMAEYMANVGAHKQIVNRCLEPWMMMKVVMTTTNLENWDELRAHKDSQPEIQTLAKVMQAAKNNSVPLALAEDQWHVPYVDRRKINGQIIYGDNLTLEQARMVSASCCAQVSYRKSDDSLDKAVNIFDRLINSRPAHNSPVEHQATPITYDTDNFPENWQEGITHMDKTGKFHSGNFADWIQFRQLIS